MREIHGKSRELYTYPGQDHLKCMNCTDYNLHALKKQKNFVLTSFQLQNPNINIALPAKTVCSQ